METGCIFYKKQLLFSLLGWSVFFTIAFIPWKYNRYLGLMVWLLAVLLLILTLFPQTSVAVGGARRWIALPFSFRFQPAELLKVSTPFLLVWFLALREKWLLQKTFFWMIPFFTVSFPFVILILQPDFGSLILLTSLILVLVFILGVPWLYFFAGFGLVSTLLVYFCNK